jgi:hypothetical protein
MSRYQVEKLCLALGNRENAGKFKADPDAFCSAYDLTPEEKQAIKTADVGALYKMGVNQQVLPALSRTFGEDQAAYVTKLRRAAGLPVLEEQLELLRARHRQR